MNTEILGIVGNVLFLGPLCAGNNINEISITNQEKSDLLEAGVTEYSSQDFIIAALYNMSYEEYTEMLAITYCIDNTGELPF